MKQHIQKIIFFLGFSFVGMIFFGLIAHTETVEVFKIDSSFVIQQQSSQVASASQQSTKILTFEGASGVIDPAGACACKIENKVGTYLIPQLSSTREDCKVSTTFEKTGGSEGSGFLSGCSKYNDDVCQCDTNVDAIAKVSLTKKTETIYDLKSRTSETIEIPLTTSYCKAELGNRAFENCSLVVGLLCGCRTINKALQTFTGSTFQTTGDVVSLENFTGQCNDTSMKSTYASIIEANSCEWWTFSANATLGGFTSFEDQASFSEILDLINKPQLQIKIPGLNFSSAEDVRKLSQEAEDEFGNKYFFMPFLGEYISAVYKFAVAAGSILAVVMIIVAGIQWTASGGSQESIGQAKKRLIGAITGLILLVGSYTILYTVNPNLVEFSGLKVKFINAEGISELLEEADERNAELTGAVPPGESGGITKDCNNIKNPSDKTIISHGIEGIFSSKGITIDYSFFGKLDCYKSANIRPLGQIDRVILHDGAPQSDTTDGEKFAKRTTNTFLSRNTASHFLIDRQGTVYPLVDPRFKVNHAGPQNNRSVAIDFAYYPVEPHKSINFTDAQYKSAAALISGLKLMFPNIKFDDFSIKGHGECQNNRTDPQNFNFEKLGQYFSASSFKNSNHNRIFVGDTSISSKKTFSADCEYVVINKKTFKCDSICPSPP
jgi:hypothetical protein